MIRSHVDQIRSRSASESDGNIPPLMPDPEDEVSIDIEHSVPPDENSNHGNMDFEEVQPTNTPQPSEANIVSLFPRSSSSSLL